MHPPKTGGARTDLTPMLYRRDTDREKPPR